MRFKIVVLPGDGIGKEIVPAAVTVLQEVGVRFGHEFELKYGLVAGSAMDKGLPPLPQETREMCKACDAILFGAGGDPKYDFPGAKVIPNSGLRQLRQEMGLYSNLRPVKYVPALQFRTPFQPEIVKDVDLVILRDFSGSFIRGRNTNGQNEMGRYARDSLVYAEPEIKRALNFAFRLAESRKHRLAVVCQYSLYATSRLWRAIARETAADYPRVELDVMAPDNCAMQLVRNPASFDVIIGDNVSTIGMLNNQAAMLMGSIGMAPSGTLQPEKAQMKAEGGSLQWGFAFYEPIHGSAPSHAGKNDVNPIATILSVALMLRHSFGLEKEARAVEQAVDKVLETHRTYDIMEQGKVKVGTREMGELVASCV